ncbi:glycerophosphodiester phosphodiesterase family protein [Aestuariivita boseongensis]|uniref:glycerophosphodiester phosphodiesterase family protein n=1 Tax=Aestuariivita boseongensis TaxID=1470562 RepID=UPI0006827034|nr:glycerophosphodiester phosphodiesterase family protein [Aestuariivita boseongensis]
MSQALPAPFLTIPLAHRALHDIRAGRPENSRAAIRAAIAAGYGIEIDLQMSEDGQAMVFHDYDLSRLTAERGPVRQRSAAALQQIPLSGGDETIPTLAEVLDLVAGRVPVLIEIKDQDGAMGPDVGPLERSTARALKGYGGPVAVMSFNPHAVAAMAELAPDVPRGITTSAYVPEDWPLSAAVCDHLRGIPDFDRVGASFISHEVTDLDRPLVVGMRARGVPVLTWTVTSLEQARAVENLCDNITFEGFAAPFRS